MTEDEAADTVREYLETLFPKTCSNCNREYVDLHEYIVSTTPVGAPHSYDAEVRAWAPASPVGALVMANCSCGSTLSLGSDRMERGKFLAVMDWLRAEVQRGGGTAQAVLARLRARVRQAVLDQRE